jgi:hypothetical protein
VLARLRSAGAVAISGDGGGDSAVWPWRRRRKTRRRVKSEAQRRRRKTPTPTLMPTASVVVWELELEGAVSERVLPGRVEVGFMMLVLVAGVEYVDVVEETRVVGRAVVSGVEVVEVVEVVDWVAEVARVVEGADCSVALVVGEIDWINSEDVVDVVEDVDEAVVDGVEDVASVAAGLDDGVEVTEITVLDVCRVELPVVESAV